MLAWLFVLVLLLATACAPDQSQVASPAYTPSARPTYTPAPISRFVVKAREYAGNVPVTVFEDRQTGECYLWAQYDVRSFSMVHTTKETCA